MFALASAVGHGGSLVRVSRRWPTATGAVRRADVAAFRPLARPGRPWPPSPLNRENGRHVPSALALELAIASYCTGLRPWPWSVTSAQPRGAAQYPEVT